MDIRKIATDCVDKMEPGLKRALESFATATNPEIVVGRNSLAERREFLIKTVEATITEALASSQRPEQKPVVSADASGTWELPSLRQMSGKPERAGVFVLCNQYGIFNMLVEEYSCRQDGVPPTLVCKTLTPYKSDMPASLHDVRTVPGTWYEMTGVNARPEPLIPPHPEHWEVEGSPVLNVTLVAPMAEQAEAMSWFYQRGGNTRSAGPVVVDFPKVDSSRTKITGCIPLTGMEKHMRPGDTKCDQVRPSGGAGCPETWKAVAGTVRRVHCSRTPASERHVPGTDTA